MTSVDREVTKIKNMIYVKKHGLRQKTWLTLEKTVYGVRQKMGYAINTVNK